MKENVNTRRVRRAIAFGVGYRDHPHHCPIPRVGRGDWIWCAYWNGNVQQAWDTGWYHSIGADIPAPETPCYGFTKEGS